MLKFPLKFLLIFAVLFLINVFSANDAFAMVFYRSPNNQGLVGYWSFNEGAGLGAADSSGNGNKGTLTGGPTWTSGKLGQALKFSLNTAKVTIPSTSISGSTGTIALWYKPNNSYDTNPSDVQLFGLGQGGTANDFYLIEEGTNLYWGINAGADRYLTISSSLYGSYWQAGNWMYIVCEYSISPGYLDLYINGVLISSNHAVSGWTSWTPPAPWVIGNCGSGGRNLGADGLIDEVRTYNRALTASEITALYQLGAVKYSTPNNQGLVGYWSFNEGAGTKATDHSGNGNTGTLTGGPTWTSGKLGKALNFNGTTNYVEISDNNSLDITGTLTISAWIRKSSSPNYAAIAVKNSSVSDTNYGFCTNGAKLGLYFYAAGAERFEETTATTLLINTWYHVVVTYDDIANSIIFYVNGSVQADNNGAANYSIVANNAPLHIGSFGSGVGDFFPGTIDEVRIYNRALSASEVTALYQAGQTTLNVSQNQRVASGLVGMWSFNGPDMNWASTTAEALDRSGNNNNGDVVNGALPVPGKVGQGLNFDGVDDYVNVVETSGLPIFPTSAYTVSLWVKGLYTDNTGGTTVFCEASSASNNPIFTIGTTDGFRQVTVYIRDDSNTERLVQSTSESQTTAFDGNWHLITWVDSNGTAKLYVDTYQSTGNFNYTKGTLTPNKTSIGATLRSSTLKHFKGQIDEVRIYSRALSAEEIRSLYNMGR